MAALFLHKSAVWGDHCCRHLLVCRGHNAIQRRTRRQPGVVSSYPRCGLDRFRTYSRDLYHALVGFATWWECRPLEFRSYYWRESNGTQENQSDCRLSVLPDLRRICCPFHLDNDLGMVDGGKSGAPDDTLTESHAVGGLRTGIYHDDGQSYRNILSASCGTLTVIFFHYNRSPVLSPVPIHAQSFRRTIRVPSQFCPKSILAVN